MKSYGKNYKVELETEYGNMKLSPEININEFA